MLKDSGYITVKISDICNKSDNKLAISEFCYRSTLLCEGTHPLVGNINNVYQSLIDLNFDYPEFHSWYYNKVIPGISNNEREILLCLVHSGDDRLDVGGVSILKNTADEKKICAFRVAEAFRGNGVAKTLFEKSFELLGTEKPLITISDKRIGMFKKHIGRYGFEKVNELKDYYSRGHTEYCYNSELL